MSLFQCDKCGCIENTALGQAHNYMKNHVTKKDYPEAYNFYKNVLGLKDNEEFGNYCSACNPIKFIKTCKCGKTPHDYGCGYGGFDLSAELEPNRWHNKFERTFLPLGEWHTNRDGNVENDKGETDYYKYAIKMEGEDLREERQSEKIRSIYEI